MEADSPKLRSSQNTNNKNKIINDTNNNPFHDKNLPPIMEQAMTLSPHQKSIIQLNIDNQSAIQINMTDEYQCHQSQSQSRQTSRQRLNPECKYYIGLNSILQNAQLHQSINDDQYLSRKTLINDQNNNKGSNRQVNINISRNNNQSNKNNNQQRYTNNNDHRYNNVQRNNNDSRDEIANSPVNIDLYGFRGHLTMLESINDQNQNNTSCKGYNRNNQLSYSNQNDKQYNLNQQYIPNQQYSPNQHYNPNQQSNQNQQYQNLQTSQNIQQYQNNQYHQNNQIHSQPNIKRSYNSKYSKHSRHSKNSYSKRQGPRYQGSRHQESKHHYQRQNDSYSQSSQSSHNSSHHRAQYKCCGNKVRNNETVIRIVPQIKMPYFQERGLMNSLVQQMKLLGQQFRQKSAKIQQYEKKQDQVKLRASQKTQSSKQVRQLKKQQNKQIVYDMLRNSICEQLDESIFSDENKDYQQKMYSLQRQYITNVVRLKRQHLRQKQQALLRLEERFIQQQINQFDNNYTFQPSKKDKDNNQDNNKINDIDKNTNNNLNNQNNNKDSNYKPKLTQINDSQIFQDKKVLSSNKQVFRIPQRSQTFMKMKQLANQLVEHLNKKSINKINFVKNQQ